MPLADEIGAAHGTTPSIAGWSPPLMYDPRHDRMRLVTQDDVWRWEIVANAYGQCLKIMDEARATLQAKQRID